MNLLQFRNKIILFTSLFIIAYYILLLINIKAVHKYSDLIQLFGQLLSFPVYYILLTHFKGKERIPWILFAFSAVTFFIGDILWNYFNYFNYFSSGHVSFLAICDCFYLTNSVTCLCGFIYYIRQTHQINLVDLSVDLFITVFAFVGIIYIFIMKPIMNNTVVSPISMVIQISYPIIDIAMLTAVLILFFNGNANKYSLQTNLLLALGFIFSFLADILSLLESIYHFNTNNFLDPLFSTVYLIIALGGLNHLLYKNKPKVFQKIFLKSKWVFLENLQILFPYIMTFAILIYVGIKYKLLHTSFVWAMAIIFLLSLRQIFIIVKNSVLLNRTQLNEHKLNITNFELKQQNQKILQDAQIDFLTQLSNRRYIDQAFKTLCPPDENATYLGILLIDVDHFKQINDQFGHQVGDMVLQSVAHKIAACIRSGDIAGRFGGDEFIILMPGAGYGALEATGERLRSLIVNDAELAKWHVTLSVGGASLSVTRSEYNVAELLKCADSALYEAKEHGRNQCRFYNPND